MAISIIRSMLSRSATFERSASALMPLTDFDTASITGSTAENEFRHRLQLVGKPQRLLHPGLKVALIVGKLLLEFGLCRLRNIGASSPATNSAFRFFISSPYLRSRRSMKSFSCRRIVSIVISSAGSCSWSTRNSISWTDARSRPSRPDFSSRPSWRFCSTTATKCAWYFFSDAFIASIWRARSGLPTATTLPCSVSISAATVLPISIWLSAFLAIVAQQEVLFSPAAFQQLDFDLAVQFGDGSRVLRGGAGKRP